MKRMFLAALVGSTALAPAALMAQDQQNPQRQQQQMQAQQNQQGQQGSQGQMETQQARVTAQQMRGQPLIGANGNRIGTVDQIVIGRSGQSYAVVQVEGGQNRLLPTQAIVLREGRLYVQDITRQQVTELRAATEQEQGQFQEATGEQVLVLAMEAEVEGQATQQQRQQTAQADGAEIVVERTAPRLRIEQPTPQVMVDPAEPEVTVRQQNPQIIVRQAPPTVTINQPQPEIIVRMPEPQVDVAQGQPEVMVRQGQPQVQVEQAEQQAAVAVEQGQAEVTIEDDQQQAAVAVSRARPEVTFERTGEPQVEFMQEQGQPTVRYERMQTAQQDQQRQQQAQAGDGMDRARQMLVEEGEVEATGAIDAQRRNVAITELEGQTVYNYRGQELGDIERVVATPNDEFLVVIGAGGFLGMAEDEVALPLQRLSMRGDQLMIRGVTEADIEGMQDYETRYPDAQELGTGEEVEVIVEQ
jgi:sporulation protein YlmC with PRC-barrel domain